jgi:excinuclease ABC subunit C
VQKISEIGKLIRQIAQNAGMNPGIYKMIDCDDKVIYIGKARHLKKRLLSYTKLEKLHNRTKVMISNIATIEYIVVNSEIEALLLENNLIKQLKPPFNILLKDDKTFPCIVIDVRHSFPRIFKCRTSKTNNLNFFGIATMRFPDNCSNEAYELCFELIPGNKEYYKLTDSGYEQIEED